MLQLLIINVSDTNCRKSEKGYWKLNNSILNYENYKILIKDIIWNTKLEYSKDLSKQSLFKILKFRVKEQTIKYCIKHVKKDMFSMSLNHGLKTH